MIVEDFDSTVGASVHRQRDDCPIMSVPNSNGSRHEGRPDSLRKELGRAPQHTSASSKGLPQCLSAFAAC